MMRPSRDPTDWDLLPEAVQLRIAQEAMHRAIETVAGHAELLAAEIESGAIADLGGPEALRLFARILRLTGQDAIVPAGNA